MSPTVETTPPQPTTVPEAWQWLQLYGEAFGWDRIEGPSSAVHYLWALSGVRVVRTAPAATTGDEVGTMLLLLIGDLYAAGWTP